MFLHDLKYFIKVHVRRRDLLFWLMLFPLVLGCFFKMAFGGLYEMETKSDPIPVAVTGSQEDGIFKSVTDALDESGEDILDITYTDEQTALDMLEKQKVKGIITLDGGISLRVASNGLEETILSMFVGQYSVYEKLIKDTAKESPQALENVVASLSAEYDTVKSKSVTSGNTDNYTQYFYNLIAMAALYGALLGLNIGTENQANLSALGAKKCVSPAPRWRMLTADIFGAYILQTLCMIICVSFFAFVLKVDFGSELPLVYISSAVGGMLGVSAGFAIGSVSRLSSSVKMSLSMAVTMFACFLSGLMVGNMKSILAEKAPWVNELNPAAVISDSIYCLGLFGDHVRFMYKFTEMIAMSAVFCTVEYF